MSYNAIKKQLKQRLSQCNYEDRKKDFLSYQKTKKKTKFGIKVNKLQVEALVLLKILVTMHLMKEQGCQTV